MISNNKLALTIAEAVNAGPVQKSSIYEAIKRKELRARKMGSRTFIMADDFREWLERQPDIQLSGM